MNKADRFQARKKRRAIESRWMFLDQPEGSLARQMQILNTAWARYLAGLQIPFRKLMNRLER